MSAGSSVNSWTILAPEEPVAETLRPLAEGTENHEESPPSLAPAPVSSPEETGDGGNLAAGDGASPAEGAAVEEQQAPEEKTAELIEDAAQHTSVSPDFTDAPVAASLEASAGDPVPDSDALQRPGGPPEAPARSSPDPDSFSDSYTHITTPSLDDEAPASPLRTETLGGAEVTQEENVDEEEEEQETLHHINGEEPQQEVDDVSLSDVGKQADPVDPEVNEERIERTEEEAESELRKRRSLLAVLDQIGRVEEEEEEEERAEEFQVPRRAEDSGFTLNKCILGAVILLGLGTIFFSESDYGTMELKDSEIPVKQEWLHPEAPPPPPDADGTELLNKLAEGNEQISVPQAQIQKEELKVGEGQAAEGAPERLLREQMEKENSRLKTEVASLRVLQRENERMKRELESVPALQKELETLRRTVTELKAASAAPEASQDPVKSTALPPGGQPGDGRQDTATERQSGKQWNEQKEKKKEWKKEKYDTGKKTEWKESSDRKEGSRKDGGKTERKKEKHEHGRYGKVRDEEGKKKQWKEKEWKKEEVNRGGEGKPWKSKDGKKEWIEKNEGKDWKKGKHEKVNEGKDWKKGKHEKANEGKHEKKDWKREKEYGENHNSREEWKGGKEWRKVKEGVKESGKEKWEGKDWREKGEKKDGEKRAKYGKDDKRKGDDNKSKHGKEDKEWRRKDERKQGDAKGHDGDRRKHDDHTWADRKEAHTHRHQPDHWIHQRERLRHYPKAPRQHCQSVEACAQGEGLLPVPLPEFQAVLQTYLSKAEEGAGVAASKTAELRALAAEFFRDGVFVHDQMSFQDFVEDVGDILEDMVEGEEEDEEEEEDSAIEDEMEEFEREVLEKFAAPVAAAA